MDDMLRAHRSEGFTLIELSIVVLVLSIMIGGIVSVATQNIRIEKRNELQVKLDAIKEALLAYRIANNRLPCPGSLTALITTANFGKEGGTPGDCNSVAPAANYATAGETGFAGAVPVKTLNLPLEYSFDPWGGRILYAVDTRITTTNAFTTYSPYNTSIGNINILDFDANNYALGAVYLLMSHGPNGHGAHTLAGTRKNFGSVNSFELGNCDCTSTATNGTYDGVFYFVLETPSTTSLNSYDDTTTWVSRDQLLSAAERQVE